MVRVVMVPAVVLLVSVFLPSCGERATIPTDTDTNFDIGKFPNSVGFEWTYEVYDSLTDITDTVTVTIVDSLTLADTTPATVWVYAFGDSVDTQYVAVSGDTVAVYSATDTPYLTAMYVFPLEVDSGWRFNVADWGGSDTCTVLEQKSVSVIAGTFRSGFRIDGRLVTVALDPFRYYTTWLVPGVGTASVHLVEGFRVAQVNETWELISYDFTP